MSDESITYDQLTPRHKFSPATLQLSQSFVSKYLQAVDGTADGFVPPLAITACAIGAMTKCFSPPRSAVLIHASQELEFFKTVPVGTTIECHTRVAQKIARGKMGMLVLELEVFDGNREKVQSGRATIALPSQ